MVKRGPKVVEGDDVVSIREFFDKLPDSRSTVNQKHRLGDIIVICVCAVISGADGPTAISQWAMMKRDWLERILEPENGIPSRSTIARTLASLKPTTFQDCFQPWISAVKEKKANESSEASSAQIAIDGKALRRSHDRRRRLGPLFLVSAWAVEGGISLGQLAAEDKSNEITAIPELINRLEIAGSLITIDAAGCQTSIAEQMIDAKGDYVLALKGNQGNTLQETES